MEDTQLKSMNGKYVEYFVFIRATFLILNTLNNPQERKYILHRLTMESVDIFSPVWVLSCLLLCKIFVYFPFIFTYWIQMSQRRFRKKINFESFTYHCLNIGCTQKAFMSILTCIENMLHKYLETEYYETGYLYFSGVILKYNIYEKLVSSMHTNHYFYFQKRKRQKHDNHKSETPTSSSRKGHTSVW